MFSVCKILFDRRSAWVKFCSSSDIGSKKKRRIRFNQTAPQSADDDTDPDVTDYKMNSLKLPALPMRSRTALSPITRASRSPRLERLDEDEDDGS